MLNPREITQYQDLYRRWFRADQRVLPQYSQAVRDHARAHCFIAPDERGRMFIGKWSHLTGLDLPAEVLWAFVQPAVAQHSGYSIVKHPIWRELNIDHRTEVGQIERALILLDAAGFITFQSAGTLWCIDLLSEGS